MASLPLFYYHGILQPYGQDIQLDEDTAKHIVQVLRMQAGGHLRLTNGNGIAATVVISEAGKKRCTVRVEETESHEQPAHRLHLAIGFTKNTSRNEWLLEKATELGVASIIPLSTARTEREKLRYDRFNNILVSALLQSQQYYLPKLHEATTLNAVTEQFRQVPQKLVAHCMDDRERSPLVKQMLPHKETIILIGPEGDFTSEEVDLCRAHGFNGVSLGTQRLRTETAAMSACAYFNLVNNEAI